MLTQLSCADTAYFSRLSLKTELQLKNKLLRVGGAAGEMENKAILAQLSWRLAGWLAWA